MPALPAEDRPIRWGIIGAGWIAEQVCDDIARTGGNVVSAVAARDAGRAAAFAGRYGAERSYGSYADLVADDEVDVVYVATTHPNHLAHSLLAIEAGRAVLVEKPVALNAADARRILDAAAGAGVFAMEAMWMRLNPLIRRAQDIVAAGEIGDVVGVRHEFGLGRPFDPTHRVYDRDNGGGALLDLGIYPLTFAWLFLGRPDEQRVAGTLAPTGVDDTVAVEWLYDGAPRAQLWCSVSTPAPNEAVVLGTRGWLRFGQPGFRPSSLAVHVGDSEYVIDDPVADQHGYGPEVEEVERCLRAGLLESPLVPHADTLALMGLLDDARAVLGVTYPSE